MKSSINPNNNLIIPSDWSPNRCARYIAENDPDIPPIIIGIAPNRTSLISASPLRINGPVEIKPLNIATTKPVERIKSVSNDVKASNKGVKITPPPTPAITAMIAIRTLNKKEITMMSTLEKLPCPPNAMPSICVSRNK